MKIIFSKSSKPLSVFIRWITGDDCSHFSFVFESRSAGLMFESNLLGTHPAFYKNSLKTHTTVHEIDVPLDSKSEDTIWDLCVDKYDGKPYDFLGALYLGWRKFLFRLIKFPLPTKNRWTQPGQYFCDELYDILRNVKGFPDFDIMNGMETPHDVYLKIKDVNFGRL